MASTFLTSNLRDSKARRAMGESLRWQDWSSVRMMSISRRCFEKRPKLSGSKRTSLAAAAILMIWHKRTTRIGSSKGVVGFGAAIYSEGRLLHEWQTTWHGMARSEEATLLAVRWVLKKAIFEG
ncbi:50S ribosomal protein L16 [Striga asiatica]|uniref:50S ribosomal protein L16 n=1 Tax=Striga asiatica TaxID=4170 RepID=A0A5A7P1K8_STRAF|nr:50S ribosomal protein L16 [Striga asiatica]